MSETEFSVEFCRARDLSIIIPTYNEAENIIALPRNIFTEILVVDDNSPDGTGRMAEDYVQSQEKEGERCLVRVVHRDAKGGLVSAILTGINSSVGNNILIMDSDFSHPPNFIPKIIDELIKDPYCIVVACMLNNITLFNSPLHFECIQN